MNKLLFEKSSIEVVYTDDDMSYADALKNCPKGYKVITFEVLGKIIQKESISELNFWFWIKRYDWLPQDIQGPVGFGANYLHLSLDASHLLLRASRGVYYKKIRKVK